MDDLAANWFWHLAEKHNCGLFGFQQRVDYRLFSSSPLFAGGSHFSLRAFLSRCRETRPNADINKDGWHIASSSHYAKMKTECDLKQSSAVSHPLPWYQVFHKIKSAWASNKSIKYNQVQMQIKTLVVFSSSELWLQLKTCSRPAEGGILFHLGVSGHTRLTNFLSMAGFNLPVTKCE